jgi:hypothetical protein
VVAIATTLATSSRVLLSMDPSVTPLALEVRDRMYPMTREGQHRIFCHP